MKNICKSIVVIMSLMINTSSVAFAAEDNNLENQIYNHMQNRETKFNFIYNQNSALDLLQAAAKKDDYLER